MSIKQVFVTIFLKSFNFVKEFFFADKKDIGKNFAEYQCRKCNRQWKSINITPNGEKQCNNCGTTVSAKQDGKLTPYQGNKRCIGYFKCRNCKNVWESNKSMANKSETCGNCHNQVYPHTQIPPTNSSWDHHDLLLRGIKIMICFIFIYICF